MKTLGISGLFLCAVAMAQGARTLAAQDYPIQPIPFTAVRFTDAFWAPRFETNRKVTIPYCFQKCEETGRISNFAKAAGLVPGRFEGIYFNDSDVYKVIEGAAYSLATHPDPALDKYLDDLIATIAAAQKPDGYLNTYYSLVEPDQRWTNIRVRHELYCAGHLFEAAVAHYQATGRKTLLTVALKFADHILSIFGPDKRRDVPGHQEIELALVKLYRLTGDPRYLAQARFFLDERGRPEGHTLYGINQQDHKPVIEQDEPVGHAVRAGYMYAAMTDIAALTGDAAYERALDKIWERLVFRKQYLTGGVGASRSGEAFGADYVLPNATAYNETCAAIANALWNHRMFLLRGDGRYMDLVERVIYNGFLSGVSLSGDRFFYPNPLAFDGKSRFNQGAATRSPWFSCSCCPVNVVRFIPSLAGYVYALRGNAVYVSLYAAGTASFALDGSTITIRQETCYPWDGRIVLEIEPENERRFDLYLRIPGWAVGSPMPGDLYQYLEKTDPAVSLHVNGRPTALETDKGYAKIARSWRKGDRVELDLPMRIRRVVAHPQVKENAGRVALERGPIVYCAEAVDNGGRISNLFLPDDAKLAAEHRDDLLGGVTVIRGTARRRTRDMDQSEKIESADFLAIPYYAWSHRELGEMAVWLPREAPLAALPPRPTLASTALASASHVWRLDSVNALNDQVEPQNSGDHSIPRFTWWDHRGTTEWVQYEWNEKKRIANVEIYWFDDTGRGSCRVPRSWRVLVRDVKQWRPVSGAGEAGVNLNGYNKMTFDPVATDAIRVEVQLQPNFSAGILEWRVGE